MKFMWTPFAKKASNTLGRVVFVGLPELNVGEIPAKIDTGAYNGALHATHIKEVGLGLRFKPWGTGKPVTIEKFHTRRVKSSNGVLEVRYAIDTVILVGSKTYPITLTLANRQTMRYPMLIGRNFLRNHKFLIDLAQDNK